MCVCARAYFLSGVFSVPVGEFEREEAFQVWTETATSVSGLLYHMWGRSLLGKHPGTERNP